MFRRATGRVLVEQLRLVHTNVPLSFVAAGAVSFLVVWVFSAHSMLEPLLAWCGVVWLVVLAANVLARRFVRSADMAADAPWVTRATITLYTLFGAVWGSVSWLFDISSITALNMSLITSVSAGMISGGMTFMAPLVRSFAGYATLLLVPLGIRLIGLGEPAYVALGIGCFIYWVTVLVQANIVSKSFQRMIELRFENEDLANRLRDESATALAARAEAEHANQAKSKFLAAASHDLRQPIHAQGLFLEILGQGHLADHQREVLAHARAACAASGDMLNTLLDFSRIEAGVVHPQVQAFALQPLLTRLEVELAPQADTKGLVYRSRETQAVVTSDPALVELILRNLVLNAIRYTEAGGVLLACRQRGASVVIEVWDTGIGIAPAHQREVYREFHQLGNPERDRRKGLGLGLAIAKGLADKLEHTLSLASQVGRGTVFRLSLPLSSTAHSKQAMHSAATLAAEPAAEPAATNPLNAHVLLIDDDETVRISTAQLLRNWGCTCDAAEDITQALGYARQRMPALIISDYRLREQRTGAEAITAVRALCGDVTLPALLITGDTAPERLRNAQASGVPLMHKPVAPADLRQKMLAVLGRDNNAA